ncbi:MAG: hypothetical protein LAT77_05625, partial [Aliidiomarina sp.]|uniref:hypothetical protein n=1 Tax=Aliidiomarina sp. TaxID=1872439 RepID=UPI0025BE5112
MPHPCGIHSGFTYSSAACASWRKFASAALKQVRQRRRKPIHGGLDAASLRHTLWLYLFQRRLRELAKVR